MARPKSRVPSPVLHRPSGQLRVRIEDTDFYCGEYGSEEAEAEYRRLVGEWLQTGQVPRRGAGQEPTGPSVNEVILAYWKHAEAYYVKPSGEPTGEQEIIRMSLRPLKELYGHTPATEFGPLALKTVRQQMIDSGRLCRKEINRRVNVIRRCFKWATENELVPAGVLHGLQAVAGLRKGRTEAPESPPVKPVPEAHINAVIPKVSWQVCDMIRFQLLTGCRPAEVCLIRPCDVERDGDVWLYRPKEHKTEHHDRERVIPVGPRAQLILSRYLDDRPADAYCFSPAEAEARRRAAKHKARTTPNSCGNRPGTNQKTQPKRKPKERYDTRSYCRAIYRGCDKAGVPRWSPNRLRHSRGTAIRKTYGLEAAQVVLGHAKADVTQLYAHRSLEEAKKIAKETG